MPTDFLGIQAFLAIVESGSFGLAAERLHLTQTAISHRMRKLEDGLGVQLVVRTSRGISLTQAGETLLPRARAALRQLEESCEVVRRHGEDAPRWVSFACLPTLAAGIAAPLLQRARELLPDVPVRVFDSSPTEIVELVQSGTAAFGLSVARSPASGLASEAIAREPFVLACPKGHPLARADAVEWSQLQGQPLVRISLPAGNSATIDESLGALREGLHWVYEAQRTAVALKLVRAGLGLTILPRLAVGKDDGVAVVPLRVPEVNRMLVLLTRAGEELGGREQVLADAALELLRAAVAAPGGKHA
jgi:DNA-binding transcriptional LysR family regulator